MGAGEDTLPLVTPIARVRCADGFNNSSSPRDALGNTAPIAERRNLGAEMRVFEDEALEGHREGEGEALL